MRNCLSILICLLLLTACQSNNFEKNPVDILMRDMTQVPVYSIMLYDMNEEGTFFKEYQHQYRILKENKAGEKPEEVITEWQPVSEEFFSQHIDDMGMELASKNQEGEVTKDVSPPGYNNYVGNPQYGSWQQGSGGSFWAFYGQYAFLSSMLNMAAFPVRRSYYDDYRGARQSGRPYYGPTTANGRRAYGTGGAYNTVTRPNTVWRQSSSSRQFRNSSQRTTRSGSRYNGGGGMRSRGGGFGK